jgi:hypothetical protein
MSGRWVDLEHSWHDTNVVHCQVCGKLIPRQAWLFEGGAGEISACSKECEQLYGSYWRPTYGVMRPGDGNGDASS